MARIGLQMEQGFDKEIDSILRRGRGGADARVAAEGNGVRAREPHLDADELSAFAEGAMPSAARVAAASHLAVCVECRGAVVGLVRAAGVEAALERSPSAEPSASREAGGAARWRERLGALFAPRVLRFVAPVLAVSLMGALAFVALRQRQTTPQVASELPRDNAARVGITAADDPAKAQAPGDGNTAPGPGTAANLNGYIKDAAPASGAARGAAATSAPAETGTGSGAPAAPAAAAPESPAAPPPVAPHPLQSTAGGGGSGAQPKTEAADEDKSSKAGNNSSGQLREEGTIVGNTQTQSRANQANTFEVQSPDGGSRAQRRAAPARGAAPAADDVERVEDRSDSRREELPAKGRRARVGEALRTERERAGEKPSAEERTAVGRRFRREGGAWVDVNYKPSMSQTGVRRSTDAFRALIADHPEVGRAAEQLSGEFIIVIRGRAYRVRP